MRLRTTYLAVLLLVILGGSLFYFLLNRTTVSCSSPLGNARELKSRLSSVSFGAVTKFSLPSPLRNPNGITAAQDGSVWFGEQTLPGFGHLFQNGTLIEYSWPYSYPSQESSACIPKSEIWGIVLWNGKVWAGDPVNNQLVALDPSTGTYQTVKLTKNYSFPYTLTVGPDNSLWFTELYSSQIGMVDQQGKLHEYSLPGGNRSVPSEIVFTNQNLGYYSDAGEAGANNGGVYAFNPRNFSPQRVGGEKKLNLPTSLAYSGGVWLALHGSSEVTFYNSTSNAWSTYPTSTVSYTSTTLPYFIKANGSTIWFNEHYGNRLARLDARDRVLTEFSLSSPPANNGSSIDNALTFALGKGKVWFTGWTANYVGYVDASYGSGFSVSLSNASIDAARGKSYGVEVTVSGRSSRSLQFKFSDTESYTTIPSQIKVSANGYELRSLSGEARIQVSIEIGENLPPGNYRMAITVTDDLTSRSAYLDILVGS